MLEADARVVGINQQIETKSGASDGVGFAVPVSAIKRSVAELKNGGEAEYAYIGVSTQPLYPQLAEKLGLDSDFGGLIAEVVPGGPADKAGLRGGNDEQRFQAVDYKTGGDVILSVEGHNVVRPEDLAQYISVYKPGQRVTIEILRDGEKKAVEVTLGKRPATVSNG
jgi:S1-C subfamily serine protease